MKTASSVEDGGTAALTGESATTETGFTTVRRSRGERSFAIGEMKVQARGSCGLASCLWRSWCLFRPIGSPASETFTIAGLPIADDAALVEAGLDLGIGGTPRGSACPYSGQIANESRQHGFKADFSIKF